MLKKLWPVISAVLIIGAFVIGLYLGKGLKPADPDPVIDPDPTPAVSQIDEDGVYDSKEDVALYLHVYGRLPSNFLTKAEARADRNFEKAKSNFGLMDNIRTKLAQAAENIPEEDRKLVKTG